MSDHKEDLIELLASRGIGARYVLGYQAEDILDRYALIPRTDMPALDEAGTAPKGWWRAGDGLSSSDRALRFATFYVASSEQIAQKEAEAETKLSERRNKVLGECRERTGATATAPYENLGATYLERITVDMIIEAQDGAGK